MSRTLFRFHIDRRDFGRKIEVQMYVPLADGATDVVTMFTIERLKNGEGSFTEAPLTLTDAQAQELMDGLWQVGIRPTEGTGSAGSLAATERHLKDMQRIAMGLLRLEGDVP